MPRNKAARRPLSAPTRLFLYLTDRCNFKCKYCFVDANKIPQKDELSLNEIKNVFDQCQALNILLIRLFGGEPLIRPDIIQIIDLLRNYRFNTRINTNGYFVTNEIARKIKTSNVGWVNVSLDGPKHIHEEHCGIPNSFERVIAGIEILKRRKIRVGLEFVLNSSNIKYFYETLKIASTLKVDKFRILPLTIVGRACDQTKGWSLSYEEWKEFYLELTAKKIGNRLIFKDVSIDTFDCNYCSWQLYYPLPEEKRSELLRAAWGIDLDSATEAPGGLRCTAAINCCAIISNGDVYPCDQMMGIKDLNSGNIRQAGLKEIWNDSVVFNKLRNMTRKDLIGPCRNCDNGYCTGYNRAAAYYATGTILGSDIHCIKAEK